MKACVILSGGMDSTTLLYDVVSQGYEVEVISFNYNQRHRKELEFAKRTCKKLNLEHKILDLSLLSQIAPSCLTRDIIVPEGHYANESMKQTIVPNRNMIMLSIAAAYCIGKDIQNLFYGAHKGDFTIYPDCRPEFVDAMQKVLKICDWKEVRLYAPYLNMSKIDILRRGIELKVPYEDTWTCYNGREKACGKCGSCQERLEAFRLNRVKDPIEYEISI